MSDLDEEEYIATRKLNGLDKTADEMFEVVNLKEISERFNNNTEKFEDILNYCRNYEIVLENGTTLRVVEKKYFDKLAKRIQELEEENAELLELKISCSAVKIIGKLEKENASKQEAYDDCYRTYKHYKQFESIPTQKVKDKIEELKKEYEIVLKENSTKAFILKCQIKILEKLLEDKK